MDPHLLRTFVVVARRASFSQAAEELGYTQSAVSQQIAALEQDLGAPLLTRRPVRPTEAGARLLEHARPLLLRLDAARAEVAGLARTPTGRLLLGVSSLALTPAVAEALAGRSAELTVRVLGRAALGAAVASGELDAGLVDGLAAPNDPLALPETGPLRTLGVHQEPLVVALAPGHPLAGRAGLRLADLADARWLDAPDAAMPLAALRRVAGRAGFRAAASYQGTDVLGLTALVEAGLGLAVLPARVAVRAPVPLAAPRLVHRVELVHRGDGAGRRLAELLGRV